MTFTRNRRVVAALVAASCLAPAASASADSLPSTHTSDAAQAGYAGAPADPLPSTYKSDAAQAGYAGAPADPLPSTHKSDAAQAGYPGTPVDHPDATRARTAEPTTIEVVRPERTIVRDVDESLPLILSSAALLIVVAGIAVMLIRGRMAPRASH
jgi:hypothetical protein